MNIMKYENKTIGLRNIQIVIPFEILEKSNVTHTSFVTKISIVIDRDKCEMR